MAKDANILDWNSTIEDDGNGYVLLDEGDYDFTVTGFERGRHNGSAKIPACNKAIVTLSIDTPNGVAEIKENFILYKTLEWKISAFFRSLGLKKHGERLTMDWDHVLGAAGRAHIIQRDYVGNDGTNRKANNVGYFMDSIPLSKRADILDQQDDDVPF